MIDLALHFATKGWPVFPLAAGSKRPAISRENGGHGCLDATCDAATIEAWWGAYPEANIGIATGNSSGLLVVDVDPRKLPGAWLASMDALQLPHTFTVRTASGGWHLYFSTVFLAAKIAKKVSSGANLLPAIDWRGNGGYVVGCGSVVNGVTYTISRNSPIVAAPDALILRILNHGKGARIAARDVATGLMMIPNGKRNEQLFRIACALRRFGVGFNAMAVALGVVNADHCEAQLPDAEVRTIAASAVRYQPNDAAAQTGGG
jgi:putative DNA primase/helicase